VRPTCNWRGIGLGKPRTEAGGESLPCKGRQTRLHWIRRTEAVRETESSLSCHKCHSAGVIRL
jgi:hypothetical protein